MYVYIEIQTRYGFVCIIGHVEFLNVKPGGT